MNALLLAHAAVGLVVVVAARHLQRVAFVLGALPMVGMLVVIAWHAGTVLDGGAVTEHVTWVDGLQLRFGVRLDGFGLLMASVVSGVGIAVMAYAHSYFKASPSSARIAGLLVWFAGAMLGVVLADNVLALYVAWELTSITSWLLIGSDHTNPSARAGALHALLITGAGGLALLGGLVLLAQAAGTFSLAGILAAAPTGPTVAAGLALVLVGVVTKSAQYPAHAWLPGAMVAPTPISAYLHSATMVKAGIYVAARLAPVFALTGGWRPAVVTIGVVTMVAGGLRALHQHDLKLLLAMSTVSQLGFMFVLLGAGTPEATVAGATVLLAHALFKATLFLVVGVVDHQTGTRDRRHIPPLARGWWPVKAATVVAAGSMAGVPPLLGFVAKESAFEALAHEGAWGALVLAGLVAGSVLTVAYSARFVMAVLRPEGVSDRPASPPSIAEITPVLVLAAMTVIAGLAPGAVVEPVIAQAAAALDSRVEHVSLSLWHGLNIALLLSAVTFTVGGVVVAMRHRVAQWQAALAPALGADDVFAAGINGLNVIARRLTGVVQSGSLPLYAGVILVSGTALAATSMILGDGAASRLPPFADTHAQTALAVLLACSAVAAAALRHRFAAVLVLGAVGFSMAMVFVVQGAPDLALTQLAIETLFIVVFMLVLRHLPARFAPTQRWFGSPVRLAIASAVGIGVFLMAITSAAHRVPSDVAAELIDRSYPEAEGRNVVNVILVDFRGLDTLGEVSVLATAALGVVALARIGRRRAAREEGTEDVSPEPPELERRHGQETAT